MTQILVLVGLLVALTLAKPFLRVILAKLFGRQIGKAALARQPSAIHLVSTTPAAWRDVAAADALRRSLVDLGFEDAGAFTVDEMPGVVIALLADPVRRLRAAVYEHPRAGRWVELVTRYEDDTTATFTTLSPTGLAPLPGHLHVHAPGLDAKSLVAKAESGRPRGATKPVAAADCVAAFQTGYAEGLARRRQVGVSTKEVVAVARLPRRKEEPVA